MTEVLQDILSNEDKELIDDKIISFSFFLIVAQFVFPRTPSQIVPFEFLALATAELACTQTTPTCGDGLVA